MLAINVLQPFGYLLFSGVGGIGDWAVVVSGWRPAAAWRLGLVALGGVLYFWWVPRVIMPRLEPFVGPVAERKRRTQTLTLLPYLVGGVTFVVAGLLNPHGFVLVLISAAAASLGTSLLAWYRECGRAVPPRASAEPTLGVSRASLARAAGTVLGSSWAARPRAHARPGR